MAAGRPSKRTVDYFPHYVRHGKTMEILEQRYGIAGYYFWFKLLEQLGDSEGHSLDCENPITWEYLASKTKTTTDACEEILNLLATLQAIDQDLWRKDKVVWSQHFVDGIAEAYRNRTVELPNKPNFKCKKLTSAGISDVRNSHSRVEESRVENTLRQNALPGDNGFDKFWAVYPKKKGKKEALKAWQKAKDKPPLDRIIAALDRQRLSFDWTKDNGQYIPHPATWINRGCWDDEVDAEPKSAIDLHMERLKQKESSGGTGTGPAF